MKSKWTPKKIYLEFLDSPIGIAIRSRNVSFFYQSANDFALINTQVYVRWFQVFIEFLCSKYVILCVSVPIDGFFF